MGQLREKEQELEKLNREREQEKKLYSALDAKMKSFAENMKNLGAQQNCKGIVLCFLLWLFCFSNDFCRQEGA